MVTLIVCPPFCIISYSIYILLVSAKAGDTEEKRCCDPLQKKSGSVRVCVRCAWGLTFCFQAVEREESRWKRIESKKMVEDEYMHRVRDDGLKG